MTTEPTEITTTADRAFALEERRLALEERRLAIEERGQRTPAEVAFEIEMRQAGSLAASPFLPANVGKDAKERTAAAWGVMRFANLLGVDAYVLAQQIYVVHGRVGFSASFVIGLINERAGLQKAIDWTVTGEGPKLSVTCTATGRDGIDRAVTMTLAQANAWGWTSKGEPWKADPELMLRYRTAMKLIRLYFAGTLAGFTTLETAEEIRDTGTVEVIERPKAGRAALGVSSTPPRQIVEQMPSAPFIPAAQADAVLTDDEGDMS
jgi:hypothetical protein